MAHIISDRVRDTTTTTGTGAVTVSASAPITYRTFSAVCTTNDTLHIVIAHRTLDEWEVSFATYSATNQLTRTTVLSSSNGGSAVTFSAGTKDVVHVVPAGRSVYLSSSTNVPLPSGAVLNFNSGNYTITHSAGNLTFAGGPLTAPSFIPTSTSVPTNGLYLGAASRSAIASDGGKIMEFLGVGSSSTNYFQIYAGSAASGSVTMACEGVDGNVGFLITSKGSAGIAYYTNTFGSPTFVSTFAIAHVASVVNTLVAAGSATGNPATLSVSGSDTDIDISVAPQGAGVVKFGNAGSMIANAAIATVLGSVGPTGSHTTVQEWLQIKNSSGTVRYIPCF